MQNSKTNITGLYAVLTGVLLAFVLCLVPGVASAQTALTSGVPGGG